MNYSKRQLYAMGEPLGECVTRMEAGRIVCGGGGGGGDSTSSSAITYPEEIKPLLTNVANLSNDIYAQDWQGYGGQRYADLNGTQQQALQMTSDRAMNGSPIMDAANSSLTGMLQGGQTNPYLDQMVGKAQQSVVDSYNLSAKPQMEAAMVGSGSFGNSGLQQMQQKSQSDLQDNLGNVATQMYGNAYNTNQANQLQALGMAQSYGNQAYTDASQLLRAGDTMQDQSQNNLDFGYEQWQQQQDDPYKKLQAMTGSFFVPFVVSAVVLAVAVVILLSLKPPEKKHA